MSTDKPICIYIECAVAHCYSKVIYQLFKLYHHGARIFKECDDGDNLNRYYALYRIVKC